MGSEMCIRDRCIQGLGFKKLNQVVTVEDTPSNRGMINKISDMVEVVG